MVKTGLKSPNHDTPAHPPFTPAQMREMADVIASLDLKWGESLTPTGWEMTTAMLRYAASLADALARVQQENEAQRCALTSAEEGLKEVLAGNPIDNWPCMACGFGHSAACDAGYETQLRERAEAAEAERDALRAEIQQMNAERETL